MSRGFVKEGDQEETPIIPPRASLPEKAINYVTPNGMEQLITEKEKLEKERSELDSINETERRRELAVINGRLALLQERIASARILDPLEQPQEEIRFGATVTYKMINTNTINTFQIVGVDEADLKQKKIAFVAPIAAAITGHKKGDIIDFKLGNEIRKIQILEIAY